MLCGATDWPKVMVMSEGLSSWLAHYVDMSAGVPCERTLYRWLEGSNPIVGHIPDPVLLTNDLVTFIQALHKINLPNRPTSICVQKAIQLALLLCIDPLRKDA
jgi:hypothetical protein